MFRHLAKSRVWALTKISNSIPWMHPVLISPPWHTITNTTLHTTSSSSSNIPIQHIKRQRDVDNESRAARSRSAGSAGVFALALISGLVGFGLAHSDFFGLKAHSRENTTGYGSPEDFKKAIKELQEVFGPEEDSPGELVTTNPDVLLDHGYSSLIHHEGEPYLFVEFFIVRVYRLSGVAHTVVVFPRSTEDVTKIVKIAIRYRMPIIPYSGATSLEGQTRGVS